MIRRNEKSLIRQSALELLKQGKSRQETFDILVEKYKFSADVADVLKQLPSKKALAKYGKWNNFLLGIMLFTSVFILIITPSVAEFLIWYGFLIYAVVSKRFEYYIWISFVSFFFFFLFALDLFSGQSHSGSWTNISIFLILQTPNLFLPFWLEKKLCPRPKEKREMYTDHNGKNKIKIVYEFSDL